MSHHHPFYQGLQRSNEHPKWIPLEEMIPKRMYRVASRTFIDDVACWDGDRFLAISEHFGRRYIESELHWDSNTDYGTCKPLEIINEQE